MPLTRRINIDHVMINSHGSLLIETETIKEPLNKDIVPKSAMKRIGIFESVKIISSKSFPINLKSLLDKAKKAWRLEKHEMLDLAWLEAIEKEEEIDTYVPLVNFITNATGYAKTMQTLIRYD